MRRLPFFALLAVLSLTFSSCAYLKAANDARTAGEPVPWWCTSTEDIPVTEGPAVGNVDWYANIDKAPLAWGDCLTMSAQFDVAKEYAEQWPTRGTAEANGFREVTQYIPGMGTHHVRGGITPAMLNSPSFDRQNPILDNQGLDNKFEPTKPDVLQFDGSGASARLVGFDYYVRTTTGLPPAGFAGNLDWWHHHPWICHRKTDAAMIAFNTSDANCTSHERREREPLELLHAPRLGDRRHEVHPRRVRRADPLHHGWRRDPRSRTTRATPRGRAERLRRSPLARPEATAWSVRLEEGVAS